MLPLLMGRWAFATSAFVHQNLEQLGRGMFIVFFFSQVGSGVCKWAVACARCDRGQGQVGRGVSSLTP